MTTKAIADVLKERNLQLEKGFDGQHDSHWGDGQLILSAMNYIGSVVFRRKGLDPKIQMMNGGVFSGWWHWPWDSKWWKPKTDREDLVRAAALIIAEIERIDSNA